MRGLNQCTFMGNVTRDIELRETKTGTKVAGFSIAVNRQWKNKKTNSVEETVEFVNIVAWDSLGEVCAKYLVKGSPIFVQGRMATRKYTDKAGVERYTTEIVAQDINFLPSGNRQSTPEATPAAPAQAAAEQQIEYDDLPF